MFFFYKISLHIQLLHFSSFFFPSHQVCFAAHIIFGLMTNDSRERYHFQTIQVAMSLTTTVILLITYIVMFMLEIALALSASCHHFWFKMSNIRRVSVCLVKRTFELHSGCSVLIKATFLQVPLFSLFIPFSSLLLLRTSSPFIDMIWQEIFERQSCANCPEISTVCSWWRRSWALASY